MTRRAVLILRVDHVVRWHWSGRLRPSTESRAVVALQAKRETRGPDQQARIHGAMRQVTTLAAHRLSRLVFEDERAALIDVALEAGLLVRERLLASCGRLSHAPGGREPAMRIVAIGTLHEALVHAMLERHRELRADGVVTGVSTGRAAVWPAGTSGRATCGWSGTMCRRHPLGCAASGGCWHGICLGVTRETTVEDLPGRKLGKGNDRGLAASRLDMRLTGSVAGFAAGGLNGLTLLHGRCRGKGFVMRVFKKVAQTSGWQVRQTLLPSSRWAVRVCGDRDRQREPQERAKAVQAASPTG